MRTLMGALLLAAVASFATPAPAMAASVPEAAFVKAGDNDGDKDDQKHHHHRHHKRHHHKRHHKNPDGTTTTTNKS